MTSYSLPPTADRTTTPAGLAVLPLLQTLRQIATDPDLPLLLDLEHRERQWLELRSDADLQVWLISWPTGTSTGWHDHGLASGAYTTLRGRLTEYTWEHGGPAAWDVGRGESRAFAAGYIHDVRNETDEPAVSLHAYSPRLTTMTRYAPGRGRLEAVGVEQAGVQW
ncbi:cysteine dioxygenase [Nocardioides alkalitolerans]|uniref:cysteine dioxygenase n=1 Tax=Nocardioides alkalitolerans TaxID=281714 RepID=UPI0004020EAC|nr:cysteine dioxygenase family protein [Nocardioides alkalitolerans]